MRGFARLTTLGMLAASLPLAASAQDKQPGPDQKPAEQTTPPSDSVKPSPAPDTASQAVPGSPGLTVATVKMEGGLRASKLIGASVYNSSNQQIGTLDDLVLNHDGKIALGVISVGGLLGVGGKLVAEPYETLQIDGGGKIVLPDANKDTLNKMPGFTYAQ